VMKKIQPATEDKTLTNEQLAFDLEYITAQINTLSARQEKTRNIIGTLDLFVSDLTTEVNKRGMAENEMTFEEWEKHVDRTFILGADFGEKCLEFSKIQRDIVAGRKGPSLPCGFGIPGL